MLKKKHKPAMATVKKYLAVNYFYYLIPFLFCMLFICLQLNYVTLQRLVNSVYASPLTVIVCGLASIAVPSFAKLVYYHKQVLELPDKVMVSGTATERFAGAGEGKTSGAVLQGTFEAEKLQQEIELKYHLMRVNYDRWKKTAPHKLKDFEYIKRSVEFWNSHPEYIPYLGSNIEIRTPDGRKSYTVVREHFEQKIWLPICFIVYDEAGSSLAQDEWKDRPADIVLFFRFIRHFGFKAVLCEQKKDGILINVRTVLGGTVLCLGQKNALLPHLLLDIITLLKRLLPHAVKGGQLGYVLDKLDNFASCIGFRIWEQLYFKTMEFTQYKPPVEMKIVCTNKMPVFYDDVSCSKLYLGKDKEEKDFSLADGVVTPESEVGKRLLRTHFEYEELQKEKEEEKQKKELKRKLSLEKMQAKLQKEEKKKQK